MLVTGCASNGQRYHVALARDGEFALRQRQPSRTALASGFEYPAYVETTPRTISAQLYGRDGLAGGSVIYRPVETKALLTDFIEIELFRYVALYGNWQRVLPETVLCCSEPGTRS